MGMIKNSLGRPLPEEVNGVKVVPYQGASANPRGKGRRYAPPIPTVPPRRSKLVGSIREVLEKCEIKDGMTLSFHHHLREGDYVVNMVLEEVEKMGVKDLRLAASALFNVHAEKVIDLIKKGVITRIEGSMNGAIGDFVSRGNLPTTAILRSHGGRVRAITDGDLHIDIAFIAAPCADDYGNANGVFGKSVCGPLAYSAADSLYADKVVIVTDHLVEFPCIPAAISAANVDYVVEVDNIGDPEKIVSGTMRITKSPTRLKIAWYAVEFLDQVGAIKNGFAFQTGAGGISLAATKFLAEKMEKKGVVGSFVNGGITKYAVEMLHKGLVKAVYDVQVFDVESINSLRDDFYHEEGTIDYYANYHNKGNIVNRQDIGFLGATEVDINFNVNVNTHSDGRLLHGIGGHQDVAHGTDITMIVIPAYRNRIPVVRESVTTVTTPGEVVDVIVTELGIAINPRRKDLIEKAKGSDLPIMSIEELKDTIEKITGKPKDPPITDKPIAVIEWRDGTVIDTVFQIEE